MGSETTLGARELAKLERVNAEEFDRLALALLKIPAECLSIPDAYKMRLDLIAERKLLAEQIRITATLREIVSDLLGFRGVGDERDYPGCHGSDAN
jgi:hypothetical protein